MTALLDSGALRMTFVCDSCGGEEHIRQATGDSEMVWPLVSALGWTGSAFATGNHLCPRCSHAPPLPARPPVTREPGATCDVRFDDDAAIVTPLTDLDVTAVDTLRDIVAMVLRSRRTVVVDLHAAGVIDSAGLSLLVRAHRDAKHRGGTLLLTAPSRYVRTVLHTMRLDGVFETHPDTSHALAAIHHRKIVKPLSSD